MENLTLILATVLITIVSVLVVGSLAYLAMVVKRLMGSVEQLEKETSSIRKSGNFAEQHFMDVNRDIKQDISKQIDEVYHRIDDTQRKIDSRCDKIWDNLIREIQIRDEDIYKMKSEKK
jgi:hypothetical protein